MASEGDPRVLTVINLVLSLVFGYTIVWGLSIVGSTELTTQNVLFGTAILFTLTWIIVLR